jgi:hypothetical protein
MTYSFQKIPPRRIKRPPLKSTHLSASRRRNEMIFSGSFSPRCHIINLLPKPPTSRHPAKLTKTLRCMVINMHMFSDIAKVLL